MRDQPTIALVAAMSRDRVIGKDNKLPWSMPRDLRRFHDLTSRKPVIMGRKTYESIGHALEKRRNIVLTRNLQYAAPGCTVAHSVPEALRATAETSEVMIIGGEDIYRQFLPLADRIYLTVIDADFDGDAYFPEFALSEWKEVLREPHEPDNENPYRYTFFTYERRPSTQTPHRIARS